MPKSFGSLLLLVLAGLAGLIPIQGACEAFSGQEFRINSFEPGDQRIPLVASSPGGHSVVIWQSRDQDASGWAIYAQRLDGDMVQQGSEQRINDFNVGSQDGQSLVMAPDGAFAVAWNGQDPRSQTDVISVRRFAPDGTPLAGDQRISETTGASQLLPRAGLSDDDQLFITWEATNETTGFEILSRRADAIGAAQGPIEPVNVSSAGAQRRGDVAVAGDGSLVAVWQDAVLDGSDWGVFLRCLDALGNGPPEAQVNQFVTGQQSRPRLARADDGRFAVVWQDNAGLSSFVYRRIMARFFDASCQPLGPERQVNQFDDGIQDQPTIAVDSLGNYIVAWQSFPDDFALQGIYARRLGPDGRFISDEFRINQEIEAFQDFPSVSVLPDDGYLFVWESAGQDESGFGIFARRFAGPLVANLQIVAGADQAALVNQPYEQALIVEVQDQWGQPRVGEPVRVVAPTDSAGVVFSNGQSQIESLTDSQGRASFEMTANGQAGRFQLLVEIPQSGEQQQVALENVRQPGTAPVPVPALAPWSVLTLMLVIAALGRARL